MPSKKFVLPVISALVMIFTGYFVYIIWNSGAKTIVTQKKTVDNSIYAKALADAEADSDNDGLKNWEEILWKTDPLKADTDGDGTSDGDEVKAGRDPLMPGKETAKGSGVWTDALKQPENIVMQTGTSAVPLTLTQQMAAKFANDYFALKGAVNGRDLDDSVKQSIANAISLDIEKNTASFANQYTIKDIKVSRFAGIKTYLTDLGDAYDKNFKDISGMEVRLVAQIGTAGDSSQLVKFDPYIAAYKKMVGFLKKQEVPPDYAALHLEMLNNMNNTAVADENLKQIFADPARALIGVKLYYNEIANAGKILKNLKAQIKKDQITKAELTFGQTSTDEFFNRYIFQ